jgi:hypothetical protein
LNFEVHQHKNKAIFEEYEDTVRGTETFRDYGTIVKFN